MEIRVARRFFQSLPLSAWQQQVARMMLQQIDARLGYLEAVGLEYLTLDRTIRTLSGGEAQRVALTSALGIQPGQHAVCAGRTVGRTAPAEMWGG